MEQRGRKSIDDGRSKEPHESRRAGARPRSAGTVSADHQKRRGEVAESDKTGKDQTRSLRSYATPQLSGVSRIERTPATQPTQMTGSASRRRIDARHIQLLARE